MRILGIDEAGRGCVLGPLFVAGFLTETDDDTLRAAGATDSKKLSAKRRVAAREALGSLGTPDVVAISADAIDAGNLNTLEEEAIVAMILRHRPDHVILDALGHPKTLPKLMERLTAQLAKHGLSPTLQCEPKADGTYPAVGAASIFAKTDRDATLDALRAEWGVLGSGYPSDPKTRSWLKARADAGEPWPFFVRTRWGTVRDLEAAS